MDEDIQNQISTGWSEKNRTCLSVDNFATVSGRKAFDMSVVSGCFREKAPDLHSGSLKYFCLICVNHYYP